MSFKLLLLQLGFTCSTAADRLRLILSDSQCLRACNRGFPLFFRLFLLQSALQSPIFELRSRIAPMESRGRPAEILKFLKTRIL